MRRDPRLSLYCLDEPNRRAIFVQTPDDVDLLETPLYYQAQFEHALRLVAVPYHELEGVIAGEAGPAPPRMVLLYSVGRCGSTLVSRMLAEVDGCLSISEPDAYTQLIQLGISGDKLRDRLRMVSGCMAMGHRETQPSHVALKFRSMAIEHAAVMHDLFPSASMVFMYRDALQTTRSGMQAYRYRGSPLSLLHSLHRVPLARNLAQWVLAWRRAELERLFPVAADFSSRELVDGGAAGMLAISWVSAMRRYLELDAEGLPIVAFRYEDLMADPAALLELVFAHCDLESGGVSSALRALKRDAQHDSILATDRQRGYRMSRTARAAISRVFQRAFHPGGPDFTAPGTLLVDR